jgi:hypothetical protein
MPPTLSFIAEFFLLISVLTSILGTGIAVIHRRTNLRGIALVSYGAAMGVALHALIGWTIAAFPAEHWIFVVVLIIFALASIAYILFQGIIGELLNLLSLPTKISLFLWLMFPVVSLGICHLDVQIPDSLADGMFISKAHTTNVKIQYLTWLPADNYIPFAAAEFFLRDISFKEYRPILPGNEVANRTVLMSLVSLPFLAALSNPVEKQPLGSYTYVERQWPDVWKLDTDYAFDEFEVVGLILNSLMLLGVICFCANVCGSAGLPLATLLYITNVYFISQTIYTWPKALAGFFILLSWTSIRLKHSPAIVAVLSALAYNSHPYAIVFAAFTGLFYLVSERQKDAPKYAALIYLCFFGIGILPWIIWTKFMLHIPSDLIAQNFSGPGTEAAWTSPLNFLWVRLNNFFTTSAMTMFSVYPFDLAAVVNYWMNCIPGAVGIIVIFPALMQCIKLKRSEPWLLYMLLGPPCAILAIYSCQGVLVLHGYQPILGVLLFFGVFWLTEHLSRPACFCLLGLQLAVNLGLVFARGTIVGAQLPF